MKTLINNISKILKNQTILKYLSLRKNLNKNKKITQKKYNLIMESIVQQEKVDSQTRATSIIEIQSMFIKELNKIIEILRLLSKAKAKFQAINCMMKLLN
jgi:hypothetical protein